MKKILLVVMTLVLWCTVKSQISGTYKISGADSVKIFKQGGATELILQSKTKDSLGFLFNKGNGITEFRRMKKVNDSVYVFGVDTLRLLSGSVGTIKGSNLGSNGAFASKSNDTLYFKEVSTANSNIAVTSNATQITLNGKSFVDSVRKRSDTLFYYTNGAEVFGFKGLGNIYTGSNGVQLTGSNFAIGGTLNADIIVHGGQGAFGATLDSLKFMNINTKGAATSFNMFMNGQTGQSFFGKATDYGILVDNSSVILGRNNGASNTGAITINDVLLGINSTDTLKLTADVRSIFGSTTNGRNIYLPAYATAGDSVLQVTSTGLLINVPRGSGGSGTPGGTDGQIQVNSAGAFAGYTTFTRDAANAIIKLGPLYGTGNTNPYLQFVDTSTVTTQKRYIQFDPRRTYTNSVPFNFSMTYSANADGTTWNNIMRMGWNTDNTASKNGLYETWENDLQNGSARTQTKYTTYYNKTAAATVKPFEMTITEGASIAASLNTIINRGNIFERRTMADESIFKMTSERVTNHSLTTDFKNDQGKGFRFLIDPSVTNNTLFVDTLSTNNLISFRNWASIAFGNTTPISAKELVIPSDESGSIKVGTDIVYRTRGVLTSTLSGKGAGVNFGTTNTHNTLVGNLVMNNTASATTSFNTGVGSQALRFAGSSYNTAFGYNAGNDNVSGVDSFNVFIGANAAFGSSWTNVKNTFVLNASVAADNQPLLWGTFNNKRLGINKTVAPTATLDVTGDVKVSSTIVGSSTITGTKFISTGTVRSASTTDSAVYWNPSNNEFELRPIATVSLQNLGTGSDGVALATNINPTTIGFYRLKAGTNVTLTTETNDVKIDVTGGAGVTDGDKGDIDVTSSGTVYTVDTAAVTFLKMQTIATGKILGRSTASTGLIETLDPGTGISVSGGAVNNTGLVSISTIGVTPNANGMTKTGTALNLEPASRSFGGVVLPSDQDLGPGRITKDSISLNYGGGTADDGIVLYVKQNSFYAGILVEQPSGSNDAYFSVKATGGSGKRYDFVSKTTGFFAITDAQAGNLERFVLENTGNARIINKLSVNSNAAPVQTLDVQANALGTTATNTDGILAVNNTAAAVGAQQISPNMRWRGFGWKTDATAASRPVDIRAYLKPVQGTANPSGYLTFESSINGAAYTTDLLNLTTDGKVGILRATPGFNLDVNGNAAFSDYVRGKDGSVTDVAFRFTSGSAGTGIYFAAANTVGIAAGGTPMTWDGINAIFGGWTNGGTNTLSGPSAGAGNSNRTGTDLVVRSGSSTGNGADGKVFIKVSPAGSSGTSENAYTNVAQFSSAYNKFLENVTTTPTNNVPLVSIGDVSTLTSGSSITRYGLAFTPSISNLASTDVINGLYSSVKNTSTTTPLGVTGANISSGSNESVVGLIGISSATVMDNSSGAKTATNIKATLGQVAFNSAGTKTVTRMSNFIAQSSLLGGTVTVADFYNFKADNNGTTGGSGDFANASISNGYGFYYGNIANGTVTNKYGFYSEDVGSGANSYSYYSAGGKNYFVGSVRTDDQLFLGQLSSDPGSNLRNGAKYYNTTSNLVRTYQNGAWINEGAGSISTTNSVTGDGSTGVPIKLVNDVSSTTKNFVYGSSYGNTRGWKRSVVYENPGAVTTSNNSPQDADHIDPLNNESGMVEVVFTAYDINNFDSYTLTRRVPYKKNNSGTLTLYTVRTVGTDDGDAALNSVAVGIISSGNMVVPQVTGITSKTIQWSITVTWTRNAYAP